MVKDREVAYVMSPLKSLVAAEEELRAGSNRKKKGLLSKFLGKAAYDFDEFLAL